MGKKILRYTEFLVLFIGIPMLLYFDRHIIHPTILLMPVLLFVILILRYRTSFRASELVYIKISRKEWIINILVVIISAVLLLGATLIFSKDTLFNLPRKNPLIFIAFCFFYPLFSAYGQEIIYRTFLFHRYKLIFSSRAGFIMASSLTFSFIHIIYYSPVSMILTLFLGFYVSYVYWRTRSVLFTAILHGILGIIIFAVGLGQYFWLDMPV